MAPGRGRGGGRGRKRSLEGAEVTEDQDDKKTKKKDKEKDKEKKIKEKKDKEKKHKDKKEVKEKKARKNADEEEQQQPDEKDKEEGAVPSQDPPQEDPIPEEELYGDPDEEFDEADPWEALRMQVSRLLENSVTGERTLTSLEREVGQALPQEVLACFIRDEGKNTLALNGKQACKLLEAPSFNNAAIEESYFELGQEVLEAGLDFKNEEKFRELFDDLLAKREDLRQALTRRSGTLETSSRSKTRDVLDPMTTQEKELLQAVNRILKVLTIFQAGSNGWVPMSRLLDDPQIRRGRSCLPRGLNLWEWLSMRLGEDLEMVTDGDDLLLHLASASSNPKVDLERRFDELSLAIHKVLTQMQKDFPRAGGLTLEELRKDPALARLQCSESDILRAISKRKKTMQVSGKSGDIRVSLVTAQSSTQALPAPVVQQPSKDVSSQVPAALTAPVQARSSGHVLPAANQPAETAQARPSQAMAPNPSSSTQRARSDFRTRLAERLAKGLAMPTGVEEWQKVQDELFSGLPRLPKGWLRAVSKTTMKMYFVNAMTGKSQVEEPKEPATRS